MMRDTGLKVLHVAETIKGGIATYFNELHELQCQDFGEKNVRYIIPADHICDVEFGDSQSIVPFLRTGRNLQSILRLALVFVRFASSYKPDVIHFHSSVAAAVLRPLARVKFPKAAIIYCPHGWAFSRETSKLNKLFAVWIERALSRFTDTVVCISNYEFNAGLSNGINSDKMILIYNGLRPQSLEVNFCKSAHLEEMKNQSLRLLYIGRLDYQKGFDLLLKAMVKLDIKAELQVAGASVVGKSTYLDLPKNVFMLGWQSRSQIENLLEHSDIVVIPSRWEGFGLVALEAMKASKPVIAFRVGALPEIVIHKQTGYICDVVSAEALSDSIREVSKMDLHSLGKAGYRRFLIEFTANKTHDKLKRIYC